MDRKIERVNPITLFVFIIISSFLMFTSGFLLNKIVLLVSFILLLDNSFKLFLKRVLTYGVILVLHKVFLSMNLGMTTGVLASFMALGLRLYPIFNTGRILIATSPLDMMAALRKIKMPKNITIALVTALRYLGEIKVRIGEIRRGLKVRGLKFNILHPSRSFELYLIPLVYKCLNVSETLTSSIISRGIEYEGEKTSYHLIKFRLKDFGLTSITIVLLGVTIWTKF